ncbi:hypothetical protein HU200_052686 [Digitaria exilis]|uniref:F-box domain-containing protein n=1 Tax=Digitaria exilis TaxID=1010633 RepID=A0A835AIC7_9POAL|nr:hypothetical protein HU200_052686 [Digitaria exilis]
MVGPNNNQKRPRILAATTIPDDLLIAEVLIHLPAKSLARCRCVWRSWRAGIAGAAFVRRHRELSRARPPSSVLAIPRRNINDPNHATTSEIAFHRVPLLLPPHAATEAASELVFEMTWPEGITRAVHPTHCDGLVAVSTTTDRVFVCIPATREFVALPLGTHNAELDHCDSELAPPVAIGFDTWRNSYVVARYFYRTYGDSFFDDDTGEWAQEYDIGHEVFTLGVAGGRSWELTEDPPHAIIGAQRPICTRRAFYWHSHVPTPRLVRFGLQDRAFQVVARPPTTGGEWNPLDDMAELDGKLCYVHAAGRSSMSGWPTTGLMTCGGRCAAASTSLTRSPCSTTTSCRWSSPTTGTRW